MDQEKEPKKYPFERTCLYDVLEQLAVSQEAIEQASQGVSNLREITDQMLLEESTSPELREAVLEFRKRLGLVRIAYSGVALLKPQEIKVRQAIEEHNYRKRKEYLENDSK